MSAYMDFVDREKRVLWIGYDGRGDELEANLRAYGVEYVPAFRVGRVGLEYRKRLSDREIAAFVVTTEELIEILTMRRGVTERNRETFLRDLQAVQSCQHETVEAIL